MRHPRPDGSANLRRVRRCVLRAIVASVSAAILATLLMIEGPETFRLRAEHLKYQTGE